MGASGVKFDMKSCFVVCLERETCARGLLYIEGRRSSSFKESKTAT